MRLFITGGSGFIGSAVVPELLGAGHSVAGLARSDASAAALADAGAEVVRGDLEDLDCLRSSAAGSDGVVHLGYVHDFSDMTIGAGVDLRAIEAIGETLAGSGKPFVVTTGTLLLALGDVGLAPGAFGTEDDVSHSAVMPRVASENTAIALAEHGVRSAAIRLSPSVHGVGDHGFMPILIGIAREKGVSGFVGDGTTRWPGVHRLDAARLFRLVVEGAPAGSRWHGVGDEGVPFREIAEVDRPTSRRAGAQHPSRGGGRPFRIPGRPGVGGQSDLQRTDAGTSRVGGRGARTVGGPRRGSLLRLSRPRTTCFSPGFRFGRPPP